MDTNVIPFNIKQSRSIYTILTYMIQTTVEAETGIHMLGNINRSNTVTGKPCADWQYDRFVPDNS